MGVHDDIHLGPMSIDPQVKAVRWIHHAVAREQVEIVVDQHEIAGARLVEAEAKAQHPIGSGPLAARWVPAGANSAYELSATSSGKPASAVVGTSGIIMLRRGLVIAIARSVPARTCDCNANMVSKASEISPPSSAVMVGAPPRYGTCCSG